MNDITDIVKWQPSNKEYQRQTRGILNDDPIKFLLDVLERVHKGDRDASETLILSRVSANSCFSIKLNVALFGDSDIGKTHLGNTCLDIVPPEYSYETTKITPKVLYYQAKGDKDKGELPYSFNNKTIFLDDIKDNDGEVLKHIANTSSKPPSFSTLINQVPYTIIFDHSPVVWTTRVDLIDDQQVNRRFYNIEVESSPDVLAHIAKTELNNLMPEKTEDWLISQALMSIVMKAPLKVKIPEFNYSFITNNSDLKFLIAMIRSIAKINAMKNEVVDDTILASKADIAEGVRLYRSNLVHQRKISKKGLKILKCVPDDEPTEDEFDHPDKSLHTVEAIHAEVKDDSISLDTVRKELNKMYDNGIINDIRGKRNRHFYYKV
jgi:hypothetical protein